MVERVSHRCGGWCFGKGNFIDKTDLKRTNDRTQNNYVYYWFYDTIWRQILPSVQLVLGAENCPELNEIRLIHETF